MGQLIDNEHTRAFALALIEGEIARRKKVGEWDYEAERRFVEGAER